MTITRGYDAGQCRATTPTTEMMRCDNRLVVESEELRSEESLHAERIVRACVIKPNLIMYAGRARVY